MVGAGVPMPDSRLPDRWLHDAELMTLSPAGWQLFTIALMFCNARESDGLLRDVELRMLPIAIEPGAIDEVIRTGRMERVPGGYQFVGWDRDLGQTAAAVIEARREANRVRQAEKRQRDKIGAPSAPVTGESRTASRRDSPVTSKERTGQDKDAYPHARETAEGWPTAQPGRSGRFPLEPYDGTPIASIERSIA